GGAARPPEPQRAADRVQNRRHHRRDVTPAQLDRRRVSRMAGREVAGGREHGVPHVAPSGGAIPEDVEPAEEPARRRPPAVDTLAHAVERDDGTVGTAFHEARPAPAERTNHFRWCADMERPLTELENYAQAAVPSPTAPL